ncbi:MAG: chemotaxis protein CheW [Sphingomonas sp.]
MTDLHLVVVIAGERVALPAQAIESVIEVGEAVPVPLAAPHIVGLAALRSRVVTLIDCRVAPGFPPPPADAEGDRRQAVIVMIDSYCYGLLVDVVEDVCPAIPADAGLAATLDPAWARAVTDMVAAGDALLPTLDPAALIAGSAAMAA